MPARPIRLAVAVLPILLVLAVAASAAAVVVTVNLQGGIGSRTLRACGALHYYTVYKLGSRVKIDGKATPAPASYHVKLKVKQCIRGTFRTVWIGVGVTKPDGTFSGFYTARRRGAFFARAYVDAGSVTYKSDKQQFLVR